MTATSILAFIAATLITTPALPLNDTLDDNKHPIIWTAKRTFPIGLTGALKITLSGGSATGTIGGQRATSTISKNGALRLDFGPENGRFIGAIDGDTLHGHWVQPSVKHRSFTPYTTPVRFTATGGSFTGLVKPLADELTFHLSTRVAAGDTIPVHLINPQANFGRWLRDGELVFKEGAVDLVNIRGGERDVIASGIGDLSGFTLAMEFFGGDYVFEKTAQPESFYARTEPYRYTTPTNLKDGIPVGTPESVGLDAKALEAFGTFLSADWPRDASHPTVHAALIMKEGVLVMEEYFYGHTVKSKHDLRPAGKSLTGTLAGLAMARGYPISLDDPLYETLGKTIDMPGKADITLNHVLSMRTGFDCDDWSEQSPGNEDRMQSQQDQLDWFQYTMDLKLIHEPGSHTAYCTGGLNLAGPMMAAKAGQWVPGLLDEVFARPLGVDSYHLNMLPDGEEAYSGGGIYLTARTFLKLGAVMADGGRWQGKQLLDEGYAKLATSAISTIGNDGYGLGWWHRTYTMDGKSYEAFFAGGNGGQQIIAVPDENLVVVFFGGAYGTRGSFVARDKYFPTYILPALK